MSVTLNTEGGDNINNLPVDQNVPSHREVKIVDELFKKKQSIVNKILSGSKELIILFLLYVGISLTQVDDVIKKFLPSAESPYILIGVKGLILILFFFIITRIYDTKR